MDSDPQISVDLESLSRRLGLTKTWLQKEAVAGRVPSLKAGGKRVFNVDAVRRCLAERASPYGSDPTPAASEPAIDSFLEDWYLPNDPEQDRWNAAIHEAGHAAVAIAFGQTVKSVHLFDDGGGVCMVSFRDDVCPEMIAAGPIAQKLFASEPRPQRAAADLYTPNRYAETSPANGKDCKQGDEGDRAKRIVQISDETRLRAWASRGGARNLKLWERRFIQNDQRARTELEAIKREVLNLASALYLRGELLGEDVVNAMYWPSGVEPECSIKPARSPEPEPAAIDSQAEQVALQACPTDLAEPASGGSA